MKQSVLFVILLLFLAGTNSFADTIYLKNGKVLRGKITQEDLRSFVVESGDTWQRVQRDEVEMIKSEEAPQPSVSSDKSETATVPLSQEPAPPRKDASVEMRIKMGSAPGFNEMTANNITTTGSKDGGANAQFDFVLGFYRDSPVGFLLSGGVFTRRHSGTFGASKIDYDASGMAFAAGVRIRSSEHLHFEGKFEMDIGSGKPGAADLGLPTGSVEAGGYGAASLIAGAYYTISTPGLQIGLELGGQGFTGNFRTAAPGWTWIDQSVSGGGGTVNLTAGYRF